VNILDQAIDRLTAQFAPLLDRGAAQARGYADAALGKLEAIHGRIPVEKTRKGFGIRLAATGAAPTLVAVVPTGAVWSLEVLSADATGIGVRLFQDGSFRLRIGDAGNDTTPVRFVGPCAITATQTGADAVDAYAQFRVEAHKPAPSRAGGMIETGISQDDAQRDRAEQHLGVGIGA
jgi:hypothetical protein